MKCKCLLIAAVLISVTVSGQEAGELVKKVMARLELVKNYSATGRLKTDVAFLKVPVAKVNVYFKQPDKFRITKEKGISILPKGGVTVNMQNMLADRNFTAIDAGTTTLNGMALRVVKLLPLSNDGDVVLTTLYIDEKQSLIKKLSATTRENGTYDVELTYGKFSQYALPDKTVFSFNTSDYKLPRGVTMEFDDGERPDPERLKNKKGTVEIIYDSYEINKGVPDSYFSAR